MVGWKWIETIRETKQVQNNENVFLVPLGASTPLKKSVKPFSACLKMFSWCFLVLRVSLIFLLDANLVDQQPMDRLHR